MTSKDSVKVRIISRYKVSWIVVHLEIKGTACELKELGFITILEVIIYIK